MGRSYFDAVFLSVTVGWRKPHPGTFTCGAETCVTRADASEIAVDPVACPASGPAGLGLSGDGMIFGQWA